MVSAVNLGVVERRVGRVDEPVERAGIIRTATCDTDVDGDPITYTFEVSAAIDFSTSAASISGVIASGGIASWMVSPPLDDNTVYYWRVKAQNTCGDSAYSAASRFLTEPTIGQCSQGTVANTLLSQGFEAGLGDWTVGGTGASTIGF